MGDARVHAIPFAEIDVENVCDDQETVWLAAELLLELFAGLRTRP
jgi:hypothetical protein